MLKQKIHRIIINNDNLYNTIKFSQSFPFKQTRRYFRNKYIKNNLKELRGQVNQKPLGQVCIETTSLCNTKCAFCPHSEMKREKKVMDDKIFNRTLLEIKSLHIRRVWSLPLNNSNFILLPNTYLFQYRLVFLHRIFDFFLVISELSF